MGQHLLFVFFCSCKIHIKDVWTSRMKRISWVSHFLGSTPLLIRLQWQPTLGQLHALIGGHTHDFLSSVKSARKAKKWTFRKAFVDRKAGIVHCRHSWHSWHSPSDRRHSNPLLMGDGGPSPQSLGTEDRAWEDSLVFRVSDLWSCFVSF